MICFVKKNSDYSSVFATEFSCSSFSSFHIIDVSFFLDSQFQIENVSLYLFRENELLNHFCYYIQKNSRIESMDFFDIFIWSRVSQCNKLNFINLSHHKLGGYLKRFMLIVTNNLKECIILNKKMKVNVA